MFFAKKRSNVNQNVRILSKHSIFSFINDVSVFVNFQIGKTISFVFSRKKTSVNHTSGVIDHIKIINKSSVQLQTNELTKRGEISPKRNEKNLVKKKNLNELCNEFFSVQLENFVIFFSLDTEDI